MPYPLAYLKDKGIGGNWLQVLGTVEGSQIDQRVCHQLHAIVPLLDACKTKPLNFSQFVEDQNGPSIGQTLLFSLYSRPLGLAVAYSLSADNVARALPSRLKSVKQLVLRT